MWIIKETSPEKVEAVTEQVGEWASQFQEKVLQLVESGKSFGEALTKVIKKETKKLE